MLSAKEYIAGHGLDRAVIANHCGILGVLPVAFDGWGWFEFTEPWGRKGGVRAPFVSVFPNDGQYDLVAWPVERPEAVARLHGTALLLGEEQLTNPASWAFGERLMVHRSALRWLKAGCRGVVMLDHQFGFIKLREALGDLEAEDEEHGLILDRLINPPRWRDRIVVPT